MTPDSTPTTGLDALAAPKAGLRGQLVRYLGLFAVVTIGAVLATTIIGTRSTVKRLSREVIERTLKETESELVRFFGPLDGLLRAARSWGPTELLDYEGERIPHLFMPLADGVPQMSSVLVADDTGREVMLLRRRGGWVVRRTDAGSVNTESRFTEYGKDRSPGRSYTKDLAYDPRTRPWFAVATAPGYDNAVFWTEPYTFFTTGDIGITASARWTDEDDDTVHVIGFDLLLESLCRFTSRLNVSPRGRAAILTADGRMLGVPGDGQLLTDEEFNEALLQPVESLGITCANDAMDAWNARGGASESGETIVQFESDGEMWWAGFRPYSLSPDQTLWITVIVPAADLVGDFAAQRRQILGIGVLAIVAALVIAWLLDRSVRRRVQTAVLHAKQLGQYEVEEKIGDGGMGAVYRARHTMLHRPTALKLLRADQAGSEEALRHFEREVRITSELTHPNTVAIYDYGRTPDGVFYYAMEFIDGVTLETLVNECGPVPPARVIHILRQVCGSLAEAHDNNLVHRDIKPANIMLCTRGGVRDVAKVLDFGLVKTITTTDATQTGNLVSGTPLYMAPEAIRTPDKIDARTDLYALSAVAYMLLTGTPLFAADNTMQLFQQHLRTEPERPSERLGRALPRDLEDVILDCLKKKASDRPATAREVAERLAQCADAGGWSDADAAAWWSEHGDALRAEAAKSASSEPGPLTVDLRSAGGAAPSATP